MGIIFSINLLRSTHSGYLHHINAKHSNFGQFGYLHLSILSTFNSEANTLEFNPFDLLKMVGQNRKKTNGVLMVIYHGRIRKKKKHLEQI